MHTRHRCIAYSALFLVPGIVAAQTRVIHGRVSERGSALPVGGARVSVGAVADTTSSDGVYRIALANAGASGSTIRVTRIGFTPSERAVPSGANQLEMNFEMEKAPLGLDAVVVTGSAGPTEVRQIGHSISQIRPADLPEPFASVDHLLASKLPGVAVLPGTGLVGSGAKIRLRGSASVALSNQPLVYVDGVRIRSDGYPKNVPPIGERARGPNETPSPIDDIDPADIDHVEVVRGPAATTLFGTEAAAGVIQIFTKRGREGKTVWTSLLNAGLSDVRPFGPPNEPYMRIHPWLKNASRGGLGLSVSGGSSVRYYVASGYNSNEGVLPNDHERRLNLRGNFDFSPHPKVAVAVSTSMTHNDLSNTSAGPNGHGLTSNVYRGPANATGVFSRESLDRILDWDITTGLDHGIAGLTAIFTPSQSTSHSMTFGYDRASADMRSLRPFGFVFAPQGILSAERWSSGTTTADYLGRSRLGIGSSELTIAWGAQAIGTDVRSVAGYGEGFAGPGDPTVGSAATTFATENRTRAVVAGVFSQATLALRGNVYLTGGLRLDGSSSFGRDLGLQPFPRLSAAWILSEEDFWPATFGTLKLRTAYGEAGRAPRVFDADRTWSAVGYDGRNAFLPLSVGNKLLGPERSSETEVGFDMQSPRNNLRGEVTVYRRTTRDALLPAQSPPSLGFLNPQLQNIGTFRTTGAELALGSTLEWRGVELDGLLNVSLNRTRAMDLGGGPAFILEEVAWISEGKPTPVLIGPRLVNPDAIAEPEIEEDHVFGPNMPTRVIGFTSTMSLRRGVVLSARIEHQTGSYLLDNASRSLYAAGVHPACESAYERFAASGRGSLTAWERMWCIASSVRRDGPIVPGDVFRLRDVSLTVPVRASLFRARSLSMTLAARNFLLSKSSQLKAFDPEMGGRDGMFAAVRAVELGLPAPASYTLAVRATYW
jgi:outer membrane receptor for ferrienterochelin and colicin